MSPGDSRVRENSVPEALQCKTSPESEFWTAQKLAALKTEIQLKQIVIDPTAYNMPEQNLPIMSGGGDINKVVETIFAAQHKAVPEGLIHMINEAANKPGIRLDIMHTWEVKNGRLIFWHVDGTSRSESFSINLLPWQSLTEAKEIGAPNLYQLGVYTGATNKPSAGAVGRFEGGVDFTEHTDRLRSKDWYIEKANAALIMLAIVNNHPDRFDPATLALINAHSTELDNLKKVLVPGHIPHPDTAAGYRTSIESKFSKSKILGAQGIYNIVLAFQRILDEYPGGAGAILEGKETLTLTIGPDVKNDKQRFSKAYEALPEANVRSCPPVPLAPGKQPAPAPAPAPGPQAEDPSEKDTEAEAQERVRAATIKLPFMNLRQAIKEGKVNPGINEPIDGYEFVSPDSELNYAVKPKSKPAETPPTPENVMNELNTMSKKYGVGISWWDDADANYDWKEIRESIPNIEAALQEIGAEKLKGAPTLILSEQNTLMPDSYGLSTGKSGKRYLEFDYDVSRI